MFMQGVWRRLCSWKTMFSCVGLTSHCFIVACYDFVLPWKTPTPHRCPFVTKWFNGDNHKPNWCVGDLTCEFDWTSKLWGIFDIQIWATHTCDFHCVCDLGPMQFDHWCLLRDMLILKYCGHDIDNSCQNIRDHMFFAIFVWHWIHCAMLCNTPTASSQKTGPEQSNIPFNVWCQTCVLQTVCSNSVCHWRSSYVRVLFLKYVACITTCNGPYFLWLRRVVFETFRNMSYSVL